MSERIKFPLLFDGGTGTYYPQISKRPLPECEMANLFDKETVLKIHKQYIDAGAKAIKTNTFQANETALSADFEVVEDIIRAGINIAREAVGESDVYIFGDIGQIGPKETVEYSQYEKIVDVFLDEGIENFLFETYSSLDYIPELSRYIKSVNKDAFIISSFAVDADGQTRYGEIGENLLCEASKVEEIDAIGFNCVSGPLRLKEYLARIDVPKNKYITIMPNGGYPTVVNGRTFYGMSADYFSDATLEFLNYDVDIIGGCCGTTPEMIKKIAEKLPSFEIRTKVSDKSGKRDFKLPLVRNSFREKLDDKKFPIAVEFDPPKNLDMENYIEKVRFLKESGADAITIADCPVARPRLDASIAACKIKNRVGIDPIVHMTCRDRNINAIKALILGLNVEEIFNLILVTGDPIPTAEKDEVKSVYQFNSAKLAGFVRDMNENIFTTPMNIGGALNVNARNFDAEMNKMKKKVESGITVFYTQPVISKAAAENIKIAKKTFDVKIMGGIMPVMSHKNAVFMNEEISGINVDRDIIDLYEGVSKEKANELAVEVSSAFAEEIRDYVDGYYIITPFGRVEIVKKLIEKIKP